MNVPKLRFKEFNDDYSKYTFDEIADYKKGPFGSALKKEIFVPKSENSIKVYEQQNAIKKDWTLERYFITKDYYEKLKGFTIKPGDIIVSCAGTIGEYYVLPKEAEIGVINQALMRINTNEKVNQSYFLYIFDNMVYNFSKTFSNGSAIKNIPPFADLKKQIAFVPSINEQNKVAKTLELLDKKIELQSKKIEDLKLFKLYISNNFFNENIKEKKLPLNNYCSLSTAKSKVNEINSNGCYYIMDMGTITSDGYLLKNKPTFCNEDMIKEGELVMPKDDIGGGLIIGKTGYINENEKYVLGDHVYLLKTKNIDPLFLHYQINSQYINKQLKKKVTGSAQLGLKASNIINQNIFIYSDDMQNKISKILSLCDDKILNEIKKFERLMDLKKGLMQSMFV